MKPKRLLKGLALAAILGAQEHAHGSHSPAPALAAPAASALPEIRSLDVAAQNALVGTIQLSRVPSAACRFATVIRNSLGVCPTNLRNERLN